MPLTATLALIFATLFTGAAASITIVEHPVRLGMSDDVSLAQWKPSYTQALPIQSGLAVAGSLAGLTAWYMSKDVLWLPGSLVLLAN